MNEQLGGNISLYAYFLLAFSLWMLVDAARRRAPAYWYFVILFLPLGAIFYFFLVKMRDFRTEGDAKSVDSSPLGIPSSARSSAISSAPNLDRADRLEEGERYLDAEPMYRQALALDADSKQALHGLGRCLLGLGRARESLEYFERLLTLDRDYRNFSAALDYADALWEAGQKSDTVDLLEQLAKHTGRINHRLALAYYLTESGLIDRARDEITRAITETSSSADATQPRTRQWLDQAQDMLHALPQGEDRNS
jgi:hypothetical protein